MEEYNAKESWINKVIIQDFSPRLMRPQWLPSYWIWNNISRQKNVQVLCLLENGNFLIKYKGVCGLGSHDPYSEVFKKLMFEGMPDLFLPVVVGSLNWIDSKN